MTDMTNTATTGTQSNDERMVIERVAITNSLLKDTDVTFSEKLNCFIGEKGTFKTSFLLCIGFAFEIDLDQKQKATLKHSFGGGIVKVYVRVAHGVRYRLERAWGAERTSVFNEAGEATKHTAKSELFAIDFYSHDALRNIAENGEAEQLALLDRLIGPDMATLKTDLQQAHGELRANTKELLERDEQRRKLESQAAEAGEIEQDLLPLVDTKAADARR